MHPNLLFDRDFFLNNFLFLLFFLRFIDLLLLVAERTSPYLILMGIILKTMIMEQK